MHQTLCKLLSKLSCSKLLNFLEYAEGQLTVRDQVAFSRYRLFMSTLPHAQCEGPDACCLSVQLSANLPCKGGFGSCLTSHLIELRLGIGQQGLQEVGFKEAHAGCHGGLIPSL